MSLLLDIPLPDLASDLANDRLSVSEVYRAATKAHSRHGHLEAYQYWRKDPPLRQMSAAADPIGLGGVPVSVKDLYGVPGMPTWAGTAKPLPAAWEQAGPLIERLQAAGAVITGKTRMVELAFGGLGTNPHWPVPRNPWDADEPRVCGGSSSGAGVSLLEGSACLALASDTAGSARIPASMTGTLGLKVARGRWSTAGMVPLSTTLDTPGLLARSATDLAYGFALLDSPNPREAAQRWRQMLDAVAGFDPADWRLGLLQGPLTDECDQGVLATVTTLLGEIERWGARVAPRAWPAIDDMLAFLAAGGVASAECDAFIEAQLPRLRQQIDPMVAARIADGGDISAREYLLRLHRLAQFRASAAGAFDGLDLLVTPTVPIAPPRLSEIADLASYRRANMLALRNTCPANFAGLCALTVPAGLDPQGLPAGLQLLAPAGAEARLLTFAVALERRLGTPAQRLGQAPLLG